MNHFRIYHLHTPKKKNQHGPYVRTNPMDTCQMQVGLKRKHEGSEEDSDESWTPSSNSQPCSPPKAMAVSTRSRGPVVKADSKLIDTALDTADEAVNHESDLSSDTEDEEEDSGEEEEEEEDEEDDSEDDYSDDDSFVTSNEDAERDEKEEVVRSYSDIFNEEGYEEEDVDDTTILGDDAVMSSLAQPAQVDLSIGGYVAGTGEM